MCSINKNNGKCSFELDFIHWSLHSEYFPVNTAESISMPPLDIGGRCIFHSMQPDWKRENNFHLFLSQFLRLSMIYDQTETLEFDGVQFVAESAGDLVRLDNRTFKKPLNIRHCVFKDKVDFRNSIFEGTVDFFDNTFEDAAHFNNTRFDKRTKVNDCIFCKPVYFNDSKFIATNRDAYVSFTGTAFKEQANFSDCHFLGKDSDINFQIARFESHVYFTNSLFERQAIFNGSDFRQNADFRQVSFQSSAEFGVRTQNNLTQNTRFKKVNFSKASFLETASFEEAFMGEASFNSVTVSAGLSFTNSRFHSSSFDHIHILENASVKFIGEGENRVFTAPVRMQLLPGNLEGRINFENAKMSFFNPAQLEQLKEFEKVGKVFFINCEFEQNVVILHYIIQESYTNYDLFLYVFQHLERWIERFTNNVQASLLIDQSSIAKKEIVIRIKYQREEDYLLFQKLTKYYFETLNCKASKSSKEVIEKIASFDFLKEILQNEQIRTGHIEAELNRIIEEVVSYFQFKIRIELDSLRPVSDKRELPEDIKTSVSEALDVNALYSDIDAVCFDINERAAQITEKILGLPSSGLEIKGLSPAFIQIIIKNNMTQKNINQSGIQVIGSTVGDISQQNSEGTDFTKLYDELSALYLHLEKTKSSEADDEAISKIIAAMNAAKEKNEPLIKSLLKSAGRWVTDTATKIGISYVTHFF